MNYTIIGVRKKLIPLKSIYTDKIWREGHKTLTLKFPLYFGEFLCKMFLLKHAQWCWFLALSCESNHYFVFTLQFRNFSDMIHKDRRQNYVFKLHYLVLCRLLHYALSVRFKLSFLKLTDKNRPILYDFL